MKRRSRSPLFAVNSDSVRTDTVYFICLSPGSLNQSLLITCCSFGWFAFRPACCSQCTARQCKFRRESLSSSYSHSRMKSLGCRNAGNQQEDFRLYSTVFIERRRMRMVLYRLPQLDAQIPVPIVVCHYRVDSGMTAGIAPKRLFVSAC